MQNQNSIRLTKNEVLYKSNSPMHLIHFGISKLIDFQKLHLFKTLFLFLSCQSYLKQNSLRKRKIQKEKFKKKDYFLVDRKYINQKQRAKKRENAVQKGLIYIKRTNKFIKNNLTLSQQKICFIIILTTKTISYHSTNSINIIVSNNLFIKKQINKKMGGVCWSQAALHQNVHRLPNQLPSGKQYAMHESHSIRFSQVTVNRTNPTSNSSHNNQYQFVMKILSSSLIDDTISVNLIILNQNIHKLLTDNYQLKIQKKMIIDIFSKKMQTTLVQAKKEKSTVSFSIQIFPFKGYTSETFKKCLYSLFILKKRILQIQNNHIYYHKLVDNFVYGCNPDKQALTMLFQRAQTSLANIAEYRKLAQWSWTTQQKLKIFIDIMNGIYYLHKKRLFHRDIRPSNIFYIQRLGRYVIGSFTKCIQLSEDPSEEHNRTVYGIQYMFKKGELEKIGKYIREGKQYAPYLPRDLDYNGLGLILHTLETMDIISLQPNYKDKAMLEVYNQLSKAKDTSFEEVRQKILQIASKFDIQHLKLNEDNQISQLVHRLASVTHRSTIQQFMFEIYGTLGYQKQYSNATHQLIQKNNEQNKSLQNAVLLKNLGQFFQRNGAKGTEYYCNACLLFLKRTQRQLNFGNIQLAKDDFYQAQNCYIKFSQNFQSYSTYIEIHRIKALIKLYQNDGERSINRALQVIKQTFQYAAKKKISIEKQMTLLLTYAKIHLRGKIEDKQIGQQKLRNGLAICQNKGAFENISSCNIYTSNFLFQLGSHYHQNIRLYLFKQLTKKFEQSQIIISNFHSKQIQSVDFQKYKGLTESNLKSCLEIREKQKVQTIDRVNALKQLAIFYYDVQMFSQAKQYFQRCQNHIKQIEKQIYPLILIKILYFFGSTLYSLKEIAQAQKKYEKALSLFDKLSDDSAELLKYNIQGNLGLVELQQNKTSGEKKILQAENEIKRIRNENFFDYVFLKEKHAQIKHRKRGR